MKALVLLVLVACGKSEERKSGLQPEKTPAAKPADPACAAKAKELEPFFAGLMLEKASQEINFGWQPVTIDRPALSIARDIDNVTITPKTVAAYDASESNHVDNNIAPNTKPDVAKDRFAAIFAMKVEKERGPDDVFRLDIDKAATWGEVVRIVDAAAAAGYTQAVFAFEATSKLVPPAGVEPLTTSADVHGAAEHRLDEMLEACRPWRKATWGRRTANPVEDANRIAAESVAGIIECNCAMDLDEVRAVSWKAARWHQAHTRVPVAVKLGTETTIVEAAATSWSDAHVKLLATSGAVKLVAK